MDSEREIELYLRSRFSLVCLVSVEEERLLRMLRALCERTGRRLVVWDHADFFQDLSEGGEVLQARDPLTALEAIEKDDGHTVFLLRDFHQCWERQPRIVRKLRNLAQQLKYTHKTILITMPAAELPDELRDAAVRLDFPLPDLGELEQILDELLAAPGARVDLTDEERQQILVAVLGLTSNGGLCIAALAERVLPISGIVLPRLRLVHEGR